VDTTSPAASGLTRQWTSPILDGVVYGQPLEAAGRVVVATEANTVYALDPANGGIQWSQHLGMAVSGSSLPCGNIDPSGITGTPAMDLATGVVRSRRQIDPPGADPRVEQQRGALLLAGGRVYVPYGGLFGDCGEYQGYVVSASITGLGSLQSWKAPTPKGDGVWAPPGPVVDSQGRLFVATGNGFSTTTFEGGNAVVRLSPDLLQQDLFAPSNWARLSETDTDLGSVSPALLPGGLVFAVGKQGVGYLLDANHLGGVGGQRFQAPVCSRGAYGGTAVSGSTVYVPCREGLVALTVSGGQFSVAWRGPSVVAGTPVVAGGVIWTAAPTGEVLGLDPPTGKIRFRDGVTQAAHFPALMATGGQLFVAGGSRVVAYQGV
jgi:outer membrane protein assembly factor BamB